MQPLYNGQTLTDGLQTLILSRPNTGLECNFKGKGSQRFLCQREEANVDVIRVTVTSVPMHYIIDRVREKIQEQRVTWPCKPCAHNFGEKGEIQGRV